MDEIGRRVGAKARWPDAAASPMEKICSVREMVYGFLLGRVSLFLVGALPGCALGFPGIIFAVVGAGGRQLIDDNVVFIGGDVVAVVFAAVERDRISAGAAVDIVESRIGIDRIV